METFLGDIFYFRIAVFLAVLGGIAMLAFWPRDPVARWRKAIHNWLGEPRRELAQTLAAIRWPFLISLITALAFIGLPQAREVLEIMADRLSDARAATDASIWSVIFEDQVFWVFTALFILCLTLFMNAAWLLQARDPDGNLARRHGYLVFWTGILPLLGISFAISAAAVFDTGGGIYWPLFTMQAVGLFAGIIVLFMAFGRLPDWIRGAAPPTTALQETISTLVQAFPPAAGIVGFLGFAPLLGSEAQQRWFRRATVYFPFLLLPILLLAPISLPQALGPAGIFLVAAIGFSSLLSALSLLSDRVRLPLIALTVLLGLAMSWFDLTDNHVVPAAPLAPAALHVNAATAFAEWSQPLRNEDGEVDGPVYLVAAQGGGLYAAMHSAMFLARIADRQAGMEQAAMVQKRSPSGQSVGTTDRIFAISGVSGGSVGAAVFETVRASGVCDPQINPSAPARDCHSIIIAEIMETDFLSPVLGSFLSVDLVARFVPAFGERLRLPSRAMALENAFADAITDALIRHGLDPEAARAAPGLTLAGPAPPSIGRKNRPLFLFNATDVDTGQRVVIGNIRRIGSTVLTYHDAIQCPQAATDCASPTMLSASLVSARFPYVSPAASVIAQDGTKIRLVDGGYFENSGSETLLDLMSVLRGANPDVVFELVTLDFGQKPYHEARRKYRLGEVLSPIRAMFAARQARGELPKRRSLAQVAPNWRHSSVLIEEGFTLSWILSEKTLDEISCHIWDDRACAELGTPIDPQKDPRKFVNRCVLAQLHLQRNTSSCELAWRTQKDSNPQPAD